jgi:multiple sugar transport system permease protein
MSTQDTRHPILSRRAGLVFLAPALLFIALFLLFPFLWVTIISFTDRTLLGLAAREPQFVGLENYLRLFDFSRWMRRGEFGYSLYLTSLFVLGSVAGQVTLGLIIALTFNRARGFWRELVFTLVTLAWILPEVAMAFTWTAYLDYRAGTLNSILSALGLGRPDWLLEHPLLTIIIFNIWRGTAFSMLLFSAALGNVRPSYLETADVAGANAWQRFRDILFPLIRPQFATGLILVTLWTFNVFTPFLLTQGGPAFQTDIMAIHTYRVAFQFFEFGRGSAIAVIVMIVNLVLASIYLFSLKRKEVR